MDQLAYRHLTSGSNRPSKVSLKLLSQLRATFAGGCARRYESSKEYNLMRKVLCSLVLATTGLNAWGAGDTNIIKEVSFASNVAATVRPGTAQFEIEGGFSVAGCNATYAAISGEDTHLISLLLSAQAQSKKIEVHLDPDSKYYGDRCLVSYLEVK